MHSHQDHYIHELTVDTILNILKNSAWKVENQTLTSAITDNNNIEEPDYEKLMLGENTSGINAFVDMSFDKSVKRVLDIGGGKYDCNRQYLQRTRDIDLLVWDPYNRPHSHNTCVQAAVESEKVDAATSMSVLNVIPDPEVRLAHINTLKAALIIGGKAYFKVWPGAIPLKGGYLPSATKSSYQANAYADRFLREIEIVFGIGNVRIDDTTPNLIIAIKQTEAHTSRSDIIHIQKKSENEAVILKKTKEKTVSYLYSRNNIFKLFSSNLSFIKKLEKEFVEQNRHHDPRLRNEYDKTRGLVLHRMKQ